MRSLLYIFITLLLINNIKCDINLPLKPVPFYKNYGALGNNELLQYNSIADSSAIVTIGSARFTVLTPSIIRMEYNNNNNNNNVQFEDRATLAFLNRKLSVPKFTHSINNNILTINTSELSLTYDSSQEFTANSLKISSLNSESAFESWHYNQVDDGNLLGTIRTLDGIGVFPLNCSQITDHGNHHCEFGLVSRNGWVVVNDSANYALDENYWWVEQNTDDIDLYFFGHGHNYKQALYEYTAFLGGKMSLVPRYATGIWWSRWYNINNQDTRKIVDDYHQRNLPLSLFVYDMDWHTKEGWGGYTFDKRLFPFPKATLQYLHDEGLGVTANLHDDDGVRSNEIQYKALAKYMGLDPTTNKTIPFTICINQTYAYGLEDIVWKYQIDQGIDFAWIDWQQGQTEGGCVGEKQNPTIWLSKLRSTDHLRRKETRRGMLLARFGGLGNHRYQVGFSGDVAGLTWTNMAYQPYFSMTASNVNFGHWSHDIVGPADDHELHTRWIQWGAYSGVFRTHDRGMSAGTCANNIPSSCGIVQVWNVPTRYFECNRNVMQARSELIPYIYTYYRLAFDTGLSLLRPMYYDYPENNDAYTSADPAGNMSQYMFGDDLLVAPIVKPASASTNMTSKNIWLPSGNWYDTNHGNLISITNSEGQMYTNSYDLTEVPIFVRNGAIVPRYPLVMGDTIGRGRRQRYDTLEYTIYPGAMSGQSTVYEDDGETTDYVSGAFDLTTAMYSISNQNNQILFNVSSNAESSHYQRNYILKVVNVLPPNQVLINGKAIDYSSTGGVGTWTYCGRTLTLTINAEPTVITSKLTIEVNGDSLYKQQVTNGAFGYNNHGTLAKRVLDETRVTPGAHSVQGGDLDNLAAIGEALTYLAGTDTNAFMTLLESYPSAIKAAIQEVSNMKNIKPWRQSYALELLKSATVF